MLLGSSGANVTGDCSRYTVQLPLPVHLRGTWQMALRSISFPKRPGTPSPDEGLSVLCFCDVAEPSWAW